MERLVLHRRDGGWRVLGGGRYIGGLDRLRRGRYLLFCVLKRVSYKTITVTDSLLHR